MLIFFFLVAQIHTQPTTNEVLVHKWFRWWWIYRSILINSQRSDNLISMLPIRKEVMARRDRTGIPTQLCVTSMSMFPSLHLLLLIAHDAKGIALRLTKRALTVTLGRGFPNYRQTQVAPCPCLSPSGTSMHQSWASWTPKKSQA